MFPKWFLLAGIEATATWRDLNGINGTWTLRIPRFVVKAGLYGEFRDCMELGTCKDFLNLMSKEGIRPHDMIQSGNQDYPSLFLVRMCVIAITVFY